MVARAGGYYGTAFKGEQGVTQGDPLSTTIFNVVVDAVVRHWLTGVIATMEFDSFGTKLTDKCHAKNVTDAIQELYTISID